MIGFICVMHKCNKCSRNTFDIINAFIESLYKYCKYEFILYLFDNSSDEKYKIPYDDIQYEYIKDQTIRGLAGPYNDGILKAVKDNCDVIVIANDDIIFNETINDFLRIVINHKHNNVGMYGPLTKGLNKGKSLQEAEAAGKGILEITNKNKSFGVLNGFLMAFTKKFYKKFKLQSGELCDPTCLWRGGERALRKRIAPKGARFFIVKKCWLDHKKIKGWLKFNESKNNTKNTTKQ